MHSALSTVLFRSSNGGGLVVWCAIGMAAGVYLFIYGFRLFQRCRLVTDTPFSKIRSASMGMVEMSGLAAGPYTMIAPLSAMPCYYHRTLAWEWKQSGKNKTWVKVAAECVHLPFFLDDNTGRVLVDPRGAELDIHRDFGEEFCDSFFSTKDPAPGNVRDFLARHGVSTDNKIKVEEFCIKPKNALFILGTLSENHGLDVTSSPIFETEKLNSRATFWFNLPGRSFALDVGPKIDPFSLVHDKLFPSDREDVETSGLSFQGPPAKPLDPAQRQKISAALLKAGIANPAAWAAAGVTNPALQVTAAPVPDPGKTSASGYGGGAAAPARAIAAEEFETHPPVALRKGSNNPAFMISWRSRREVARSLRWKSTLMIWGGPALALLSLYFLLSMLNLL